MSIDKTCKGCGIKLQTENSEQLGYIKDLNHDLCLDCFSLKHYQKAKDGIQVAAMPEISERALIVYVLSINHISERLKYRLDRHFLGSDFILVLNHIDTLEQSANLNRMIHKIREETNVLQMKWLDIVPISAKTGKYVDELMASINYHQNGRNVYLVGYQNSGKSTLFKKIADKLDNDVSVLAGKKPGLTQGLFSMPYNKALLYDTPGIYLEGSVAEFYPYELYKDIIVEKKIKPTIFQLNEQQSVIIGGQAIFSFLKGGFKGISFHFNKQVNLHRTKYEQVYQLFDKHKGNLFKPYNESHTYVKKTFKLEPGIKYEIAISDIGAIHLQGSAIIEIYHLKGLRVTMTESLY
ncbi:MAG TPA: GTPase [Acholeplasma sp.]|nr:GTPase [Acholeplasma sp.]